MRLTAAGLTALLMATMVASAPSLADIRDALSSKEDTILHLILARAAIGPAGESAQSPQLHSSLSALAEQGPVAVESSFASPRPFPPYVAKPVNHLQWGAATSDANHSSLIEYWYNDVIPTIANKNASLKALPSSSSPGTALSVSLLTTWSYRIDTGRQVADAKFSNNRTAYCPLIKKRDSTGLRKMVTDKAVEEALKMRVRNKLKTWSSQAWQPDAIEVVVGVFTRFLIPTTTDVEVATLLKKVPDCKSNSVVQSA